MKNWIARLFRGSDVDGELQREIEFHLEMRASLNGAAGLGREESHRLARRQFGSVASIQEEMRRMHVNEFMESVLQDGRYALRSFLRWPSFTATALLAITLGIGATTAVFSVVDRVLFRGLPYPDQDRLVSFGFTAPIEPNEFMLGADYYEWRTQQTPFTTMTSWTGINDCDLTEASPERLRCARAEASFLPTLGIMPLAGRNFTAEEDRSNGRKVALISERLWRTRFGGDPNVLGRALSLDGERTTIVGILRATFEFPNLSRADILLPQALDDAQQRHPNTGAVLRTFARLKPRVSVSQAQQALQPLFDASLQYVPAAFRKEVQLRVRTIRDWQMEDARAASWMLWAAVVAVLLIACANVANLLLARSAMRDRELSVRSALGGSRVRLARQALTESLLLATLGVIPGCLLAWGLLRVFSRIAPNALPGLAEASVDGRVLLFSAVASFVCGLLFGVAPALERRGAHVLSTQRAVSAPRHALRHALIAVQICASLMLLTGAGLLLRSLWNFENAPLGLDAEHVVTAALVLPQQTDAALRRQIFEDIESRLRHIPGIVAAAVSDSLPPSGAERTMIYSMIQVQGQPRPREGTGGMVGWRAVTPDYFKALRIGMRAGRGFTEQDRDANGPGVVVLSETLARRLYPDADPLGSHIRIALEGRWHTVVGVAADVHNNGISGHQDPEYYLIRKHSTDLGLGNQIPREGIRHGYAIVRTALAPDTTAAWMRSEISAVLPTVPLTLQSMSERVGELAQRPRFDAMLLALFAGMAALLAAIGLYGVVAFLVAERTQEIGVRMALGATPAMVIGLVLERTMTWTIVGAGAGVGASWVVARVLRSLLFGVPANDPATFLAPTGILVGVAFAAAWIPSRRAARVDPTLALKHE